MSISSANLFHLGMTVFLYIGLGSCFLQLIMLQRNLDERGTQIYSWLLLSVMVYVFGYANEINSTQIETAMGWIRLEYFGISFIPILWLLLVLYYCNQEEWLEFPRIVYLLVYPVLEALIMFTNDYHHLYYRSALMDLSGPYPMVIATRGVMYYLSLIYFALALGASYFLLIRQSYSPHAIYRRQTQILLICGVLTGGILLVYQIWFSKILHVDFNCFVILIGSVILGWALLRYRFIEIKPYSEEQIQHKFPAGLIIIDLKDRILEINQLACEILSIEPDNVIGKPIQQAASGWKSFQEEVQNQKDDFVADLSGAPGVDDQVIEISTHQLSTNKGITNARMIVLRDVTQRIRTEERLLNNERKVIALEERERLAAELHDGIGQVIGQLQYLSQTARENIRQGEIDPATGNLNQIEEISRDIHADFCDYILGIKTGTVVPPDQRGILVSLKFFIENFTERYGVKVGLSVPELPDSILEPMNEFLLLRIIQEAVINAGKHAGAGNIQITFFIEDNWLRVVIADNGRGFNVTDTLNDGKTSPGLKLMQQRASKMGGRIEFRSAPGDGALVFIDAPCLHPISGNILSGLRILLVDDQILFREGLRNLLVTQGVQIVGEAGDGGEAIILARQLQPDLVLMDMSLPDMAPLDVLSQVKAETARARVIMLTVTEDESAIVKAMRAGASGYLSKSLKTGEFFHYLETFAQGEMVLLPGMARYLLGEYELAESPEKSEVKEQTVVVGPTLTRRQVEILELSAQRMTYKEIAARLFLSEATVKYHVSQILERLQVRTRLEALQIAEKEGIITSYR